VTSLPASSSSFNILSSGGKVIIATPHEKALAYDTLHYAPARRVGNMLYVSGVIVYRLPEQADDTPAFMGHIRRAFHT